MLKSWRLGSLVGFPIDVNLSFLLLLGFVFIAFGGIAGVVVVCLAFGSVLLHELGHALVARRLGVRISGIELGFLGGAAKMIDHPPSANAEIAIAAAGPAVSVALGAIGVGLGAAIGSPFIGMLGWINIVLAAFNLIPALPMDGGRILRAALTKKLTFLKATEVAVKVSRFAAVAFGILGLAWGAYQLAFLAPFLWIMGTRELFLARQGSPYRSGTGNGFRVVHRNGQTFIEID